MNKGDSLPGTIDEVLDVLDGIISETTRENNYLGIFAYVYRRTTAEIRTAIRENRFEDGLRMERMDVTFANRYISAYRNFKRNDGPVFNAWLTPFRAGAERLTIMQHLLMGMNAHINLDLGLAAAETAPGEAIHELKNDFMKVNDILAELTGEMQLRIGRISPLMRLADRIGGRKDDAIVNFSMVKAREQAWTFACDIAGMNRTDRENRTRLQDTLISALAGKIKQPPGRITGMLLKIIALTATKNVNRIIDGLSH